MISIIAAIGLNRELGKDNKLLWHIPEDMRRFKKLTQGHAVIMGRKTFESIGKPLPDRYNIIVTRDKNWKPAASVNYLTKVLVCHSLDEAVNAAKSLAPNYSPLTASEVFIIGGSQIYEQAIGIADRLYLTIVTPPENERVDADVFFPKYLEFKKVITKEVMNTGVYQLTFLELKK